MYSDERELYWLNKASAQGQKEATQLLKNRGGMMAIIEYLKK